MLQMFDLFYLILHPDNYLMDQKNKRNAENQTQNTQLI